jgi:hypothetical protein
MKVENLKTTNGTGYIHQQAAIQRGKSEQISSNIDRYESQDYKDKIRIPSNYQAKRMNLASTITREEQKFFEDMYPSYRQKIKAYLSQQQASVPSKGQFIDIRR